MKQEQQEPKRCKCGVIATPENTTKTYLKRKTPICKVCIKKYNDKHNLINNPKNNPLNNSILKEKYLNMPLVRTKLYTNPNTPRGEHFYEQYIKPKPKSWFNFPLGVQSPMGTYKTQLVMSVLRSFPLKKIVYVTPNITTIDSTKSILQKNSLQCQDYRDSLTPELGITLITPDSFYKLKRKNFHFDILIIDEAQTIFSEMNAKVSQVSHTSKFQVSPTSKVKNPFEVYENYLNSYTDMINSPTYLLLDAYLSPELLGLFKYPCNLKVNTYRKGKTINFYSSEQNRFSEERFINSILDYRLKHPEDKILVQADSIRFLEKVKTLLEYENQDFILFTDKTNRNMKIHEIDAFSTMLCSPKIKVGVSLTADAVFLYSCGQSVHPYSIFQMADRARDSKEINICMLQDRTATSSSYLENHLNLLSPNHAFLTYIKQDQKQREQNIQAVQELLQNHYIININSIDDMHPDTRKSLANLIENSYSIQGTREQKYLNVQKQLQNHVPEDLTLDLIAERMLAYK